jgi:hypothetical protein
MSWRKINRVLHRDLGYLCVGLTLIYAISGIALNHVEQWNPNYVIEKDQLTIGPVVTTEQGDPVEFVLKAVGDASGLRSSFRPDPETLQVFTERGSYTVRLADGRVDREFAQERPGLFPMNYLHLNHAKKAWTWVADLYAVALIALAVSGLFLVRGRKGIRWRGTLLTSAGALVPLVFFWLYR